MAAQDMRQHHVDALADQLPGRPWKRLSAGQGVKGERLYDWALMLWAECEGWEHALLVRRSLEAEPEYAFYFTYAPKKKSTLKTLVAVAGQRWAIESAFQMAKPAPPRTGLCPWGGKVSANWIISKSGTGRAGIGTSPSTPATKTCRRRSRSGGRVDLNAVASGYINSGSAIGPDIAISTETFHREGCNAIIGSTYSHSAPARALSLRQRA